MLATERDDSALLPGMFRLAVTGPDEPQPVQLGVNGPFALIGRDESCACRLDHADVSRRHAYLQAIFGRIFCIDLGSRTGTYWGDTPLRSGWLDPGVPVRIGPYQIELIDTLGFGRPSAPFPDNFSPLDPYTGQLGKLPRVDLEILNGAVPSAEMTISRLITLVGSSARCKLRLQHASVARVDCGLVWLSDGLWVVDLSGRGHSRVRGKILRCARLENDQKLRLGRFHLCVQYPSEVMSSHRPDAATSDGDQLEIELATAEEAAPQHKSSHSHDADPTPTLEDERAAVERERRKLATERHAAHERERALDAREAKLSEAQGRLASEWEHLHVDRAAYEALATDFARRQEEMAARLRRLAEDTEALGHQRIELANRTAELTEFKQRLAYEWQRLNAERGLVLQPGADGTYPLLDEPVADPTAQPAYAPAVRAEVPSSAEIASQPVVEAVDLTPMEFDVLETVRHNKVFAANRAGTTLVVTPLGDASEFFYGDVHIESNKVRRLLESGAFNNLVVDLGETEVYSQVTFNFVVALSRIISNRGGQAVLCRASEKTRGLLRTMRLLDVWPLYDSLGDALRAVDGAQSV